MNLPWQQAGQAFFLFVLGAMMAYNTWQGQKIDSKLHEVHVLANSAMLMTQKSLAEVTAAKYAITKDPVDRSAADKAMADYLAHIRKQSELNN